MRREELKAFDAKWIETRNIYCNNGDDFVDDDWVEGDVYDKEQADSVMDEMEARIKELEASQPKWIETPNFENVKTGVPVVIQKKGVNRYTAGIADTEGNLYDEDGDYLCDTCGVIRYMILDSQPPKCED